MIINQYGLLKLIWNISVFWFEYSILNSYIIRNIAGGKCRQLCANPNFRIKWTNFCFRETVVRFIQVKLSMSFCIWGFIKSSVYTGEQPFNFFLGGLVFFPKKHLSPVFQKKYYLKLWKHKKCPVHKILFKNISYPKGKISGRQCVN